MSQVWQACQAYRRNGCPRRFDGSVFEPSRYSPGVEHQAEYLIPHEHFHSSFSSSSSEAEAKSASFFRELFNAAAHFSEYQVASSSGVGDFFLFVLVLARVFEFFVEGWLLVFLSVMPRICESQNVKID
jgi:hypothetical protein